MVAILAVSPWKTYALYYRDPDTRSFKRLMIDDIDVNVKFSGREGKGIVPYQIILEQMQDPIFSRYGGSNRMFSRKQPFKYVDLSLE